jgi:transcriptional regulator with XRE-family HTH domain
MRVQHASTANTSPSPETIRRARRAAGLTQRGAAALIGISHRTFPKYEQGEVRMRPDRWELLKQKLAGETAEALLQRRLEETVRRFRAGLGARRGRPFRGRASTVDDNRHAALLRLAIASCTPTPSLEELAHVTGYSVHEIRAWLK